jgi:hypothetical protein
MKRVLIFILIQTLFSCTKDNQKMDVNNIVFPKIVYVNHEEGLRKRSGASVYSNVVGLLLHGERIIIYTRTNNIETIDGITDYWYSINYANDLWVFGGYLSEKLPSDLPIILGKWNNINSNNEIIEFKPSYDFSYGIKNTDNGAKGIWKLNENKIILNFLIIDIEIVDETIEIELTVIDSDNIILKFPNKTVELKRDNNIPEFKIEVQ